MQTSPIGSAPGAYYKSSATDGTATGSRAPPPWKTAGGRLVNGDHDEAGAKGKRSEVQIILFVNTSAGGQKGQKIMGNLPRPFVTTVPGGQSVRLLAYALQDGSDGAFGRRAGFEQLKQCIRKSGGGASDCPVRVIAAGGDGTLKWVVQEAIRHGIDHTSDCLWGILPLGTGNDFSRSLGWGGKWPTGLVSGKMEKLKALVAEWLRAPHRAHDVWHVKIQVNEDRGKILVTSNKGGGKKVPLEVTSMSMQMLMYFTVGADAQVGLGFDRLRRGNRLWNRCAYIFEGIKKELICRRKHRVADVIYGLYNGIDYNAPVIFDTLENSPEPQLSSDPQILAFLNIPSYAGGMAQLWPHAKKLGVDRPLDDKVLTVEQSPGDKKLEVVTIRSPARVVFDCVAEQVSQLGARRVFSGAPFFMEFVEEDDDVASYCQVDGEFYKLVNPEQVTVTHEFQLKVMHNVSTTNGAEASDESDSSDAESGGESSDEAPFRIRFDPL
eukprot:TRINITY_DN29695_c0_g1_i1.p1 TRINITY_DN29695_c0_g1~~TRINITY_DN29695_c0_g1_i1.p1  ORF type:complete len:494 (-),score=94.56 TRINITY_DN29695_c0_g1_i1:192-1673(-)